MDFQLVREMAEAIEAQDLATFECKAQTSYVLSRVRYILVDEAQDTPPEAVHVLRVLRKLGKTVVITGDRHQGIFGFMNTESLFEALEGHEKVTHTLSRTRRCGHHVVQYVNERFGLGMVAMTDHDHPGPRQIQVVCVQAWRNSTLARLYVNFLFSISAVFQVHVAEGESREKFDLVVLREVDGRYGYRGDLERAATTLRLRKSVLEGSPARVVFIFSTVHCFKGGECDVTILSDDLQLQVRSDEVQEERVKYVAVTRARWGVLDLHSLQYIGHPRARALLHKMLIGSRAGQGKQTVSALVGSSVCLSAIVACPALRQWSHGLHGSYMQLLATTTPVQETLRNPLFAGSVADVLMGWWVERAARVAAPNLQKLTIQSNDMRARASDDYVIASMLKYGTLPRHQWAQLKRKVATLKLRVLLTRYMVAYGHWSLTSDFVLNGAFCKSLLGSLYLTKNVMALQYPLSEDVDEARELMGVYFSPQAELVPSSILSRPSTWHTVAMQSHVDSEALSTKGCFDVFVMDNERVCHVVEVKHTRRLSVTHLVQTVLYAALVQLWAGIVVHRAEIYDLMRNECLQVPVRDMMHHLLEREAMERFSEAGSCKTVREYYDRTRSADALARILNEW